MNGIDAVNRRYETAAEIVRRGVELLVVGDPAGASLNAAVRALLLVIREEGPGLWDDLAGASKALRWRLVTQPQPLDMNPALRHGAEDVMRQVSRLRGCVADSGEQLLDELQAATEAMVDVDPVTGPVLLRSIEEVGETDCVVVAASSAAAAGLEGWLGGLGIQVRTAGELQRNQTSHEQAYAVGPPRLFRSALVTAPTTNAVSFVLPGWYGDRSIPRSAIAPYTDGAVAIRSRVFTEGDFTEPPQTSPPVDEDVDDELLPQPVWGSPRGIDREPGSDEVVAHRVLLSGDLAILLDDGDRIRTLDPSQPAGERVTYTDVPAVRRGTYLLLRRGETERRALYDSAVLLMGTRSAEAAMSQVRWKEILQERLSRQGHGAVQRELRARGLQTLDRIRAWTDPTLARPQNARDFEVLLQWLGLPVQPSFGLASTLSRLRHKASAEIREQLEDAVAGADMSALERQGHMHLDLKTAGFRGMVATRVLAISPRAEIVARHEARVPFADRSGQWLE
jgi:hypothetical protein